MVMTESPIPREQRPAIASYLSQRLAGPVGIDVWTQQASQLIRTDRDPCTFCDQVASAAKQLASLHPLISLTLYDLDRHADRAREAGIERPPVTVVRGANGREFRLVGMWSGLLFPAFVDGVVFAGAGEAPIQEQTRAALQALNDERTEPLPIELLIAPYDPYSAHTLRIAEAFAIESRRIRLEAIEVSEFPRLASARMVRDVPVLSIDGRRFPGAWEEQELIEQIRRVVLGNSEPVIRQQVLTAPFMTVEEAQELAAREGQPPQGPSGAPPTTPGGLVLPGR